MLCGACCRWVRLLGCRPAPAAGAATPAAAAADYGAAAEGASVKAEDVAVVEELVNAAAAASDLSVWPPLVAVGLSSSAPPTPINK